ncbi:3-Oxo-5-Alpha-Steroid 4-Dehydrogenase 2 [Manis pentadactyla]|nr:3-Oxo-5-Alpha-Steroid 4-Dehydrogenase 2 [Manis pentadactyla]
MVASLVRKPVQPSAGSPVGLGFYCGWPLGSTVSLAQGLLWVGPCQPTDKALGSTSTSLMAGSDAQDEPMDTMPPLLAIIFRSRLALHEAMSSTNFGPRSANDPRDEPMDRTPPSMAVIFWWPLAMDGPVGSTTTGLLCIPDTHRTGSHRLVSPGPI